MPQTISALARHGSSVDLEPDSVASLAGGLDGALIDRSSPDYDEVRLIWNGMIDKHPALIAICESTADVVATLRFARAHDLVMSVRGGGHNAAGASLCDDGIVIDLSGICNVVVDPETARVRAGGGTTVGQLDAATQAHGLAVPLGVVTETGVVSLASRVQRMTSGHNVRSRSGIGGLPRTVRSLL